MKTFPFFLGIFLTGIASLAAADNPPQQPSTREIQVGVNDAYVPGGFDSGSDIYVVTSGLFPNGCYRWEKADVKNVDAFTHEVSTYATVTQGMCLMVLLPFNKEVQMGKFAPGKHTLRFLNGDGTYLEKTLTIEK